MYLCARGIDFVSTILIFDFGIVQTVELFRLWYCSDCGIVQTVELFRLWYCSDCGIVQTVVLFRL